MARTKERPTKEVVKRAKRKLREFKNEKIIIKLRAIVAAEERSVVEVADIIGVGKSTLYRWIEEFSSGGVEELKDKESGHREPKLKEEHKEQIKKWLNTRRNSKGERVNWTLEKLRQEIKECFGIEITIMPLWRHVHKMGFEKLRPRPKHYKADPEQQEQFKKKVTDE